MFRPVYDTLAGMGFYNLNPAQIRELQSPDPGELLDRDGGNVASVLDRMKSQSPSDEKRIGDYLAKVAPGTSSVEPRTIGPKLTLEFRQQVRGDPNPWRFLANKCEYESWFIAAIDSLRGKRNVSCGNRGSASPPPRTCASGG